ncbi:MAG: VPLPA-CTERM sorting domain-containing protein [Pseudomonadota bacterium]
MKRSLWGACLCVGAVFGADAAPAASLDLSGLTNGTILSTQNFSDGINGVEITAQRRTGGKQLRPGVAALFDSAVEFAKGKASRDKDLAKSPTGQLSASQIVGPGISSPVNTGTPTADIIIIQENPCGALCIPDDNARGGTLTFDFTGYQKGVQIKKLAIFDFNGFTGKQAVDDIVLTRKNGLTEVVQLEDYITGGLQHKAALLDFDAMLGGNPTDVVSLTFNTRTSGGIGMLEFAPVPLPAAFPLLAFGIGALVVVGRRRKKVAA